MSDIKLLEYEVIRHAANMLSTMSNNISSEKRYYKDDDETTEKINDVCVMINSWVKDLKHLYVLMKNIFTDMWSNETEQQIDIRKDEFYNEFLDCGYNTSVGMFNDLHLIEIGNYCFLTDDNIKSLTYYVVEVDKALNDFVKYIHEDEDNKQEQTQQTNEE